MKVLCLVGTRPEAIKMAPIIRVRRERTETVVLCSGQHTDMVASALNWFAIAPDDSISLPIEDRSLALLTGLLFPTIDSALVRHRPDVVVAQGDTTTVMVTVADTLRTMSRGGSPFEDGHAAQRICDTLLASQI